MLGSYLVCSRGGLVRWFGFKRLANLLCLWLAGDAEDVAHSLAGGQGSSVDLWCCYPEVDHLEWLGVQGSASSVRHCLRPGVPALYPHRAHGENCTVENT